MPPEPKMTQEQKLQRWADGKGSLKEVRGYSDDELYSIARVAYFYFYQGKIDEARTLFQGLYAINPSDVYFAKALGVVEMAAGNAQGALSAYEVALKIAPQDAAAMVGRAECKIAMGQRSQAVEDLRRAFAFVGADEAQKDKISGMLRSLTRK